MSCTTFDAWGWGVNSDTIVKYFSFDLLTLNDTVILCFSSILAVHTQFSIYVK